MCVCVCVCVCACTCACVCVMFSFFVGFFVVVFFVFLFFINLFLLSFSHEMSWMSGTELSQLLRVFLPTLLYIFHSFSISY